METQETINTKTLSRIADAMSRASVTWTDMKCTSCSAVRPYVVTQVQVDYDSQLWELETKPWRVTGLQRLPAPGWVELSIEGNQNGSCTKSVYCPKCAPGRLR